MGEKISHGSRILKVLVVEDHADEREILRRYLESRGWEVHTAADGEEAVSAAQTSRPDIILMDIALPERSGISATYRILKTPGLESTPVVALTGFTNEDLRRDALAAGCREVLLKPVSPSDLDDLVLRYAAGG